jgi:hypothetical protein
VTLDTAPARLTLLIDRLVREYAPAASRAAVAACVESAWDAVMYFNSTDDSEMLDLAERVAERELRLRLGLEREVARLDPESHAARRAPS